MAENGLSSYPCEEGTVQMKAVMTHATQQKGIPAIITFSTTTDPVEVVPDKTSNHVASVKSSQSVKVGNSLPNLFDSNSNLSSDLLKILQNSDVLSPDVPFTYNQESLNISPQQSNTTLPEVRDDSCYDEQSLLENNNKCLDSSTAGSTCDKVTCSSISVDKDSPPTWIDVMECASLITPQSTAVNKSQDISECVDSEWVRSPEPTPHTIMVTGNLQCAHEGRNVLQDIAAGADICKCNPCNCDPTVLECQSCSNDSSALSLEGSLTGKLNDQLPNQTENLYIESTKLESFNNSLLVNSDTTDGTLLKTAVTESQPEKHCDVDESRDSITLNNSDDLSLHSDGLETLNYLLEKAGNNLGLDDRPPGGEHWSTLLAAENHANGCNCCNNKDKNHDNSLENESHKEPCCVMVCLRTLEQLRKVLQRGCCSGAGNSLRALALQISSSSNASCCSQKNKSH